MNLYLKVLLVINKAKTANSARFENFPTFVKAFEKFCKLPP